MERRTWSPKASEITRDWFVVDAEGQVLGRLATDIARILRGKHKATYAPHMDMGDYVIVINAEKIQVTGTKETTKMYHHHSGYPGGLTSTRLADMRKRHPDRILREAVRGMLPKNALGEQMINKLKMVEGDEHPYGGQQPKPLVR